ncbi:MAG: hypothetical protein NVSMB18_36070 [Acetobacteraceae bacterium]
MLDLQPVARFEFKLIASGRESMQQETTPADPEDRLEAALERIAQAVAAPDPVATEVANRLDTIITTLRDALDK